MAFDPNSSPFVASLRRLEGVAPTPMAFVPVEDDPVDLRGATRPQVAYYAWLRHLFHEQQDHYGISEGYARLLASEILTGTTFDRPSLVATLVELLGWIGRNNLRNPLEFAMLPLIANARTGSKTSAAKVAFKVWMRFGVRPHSDLVWEGIHWSFRTLGYENVPITNLVTRPDEGWPLETPREVGSAAWRAALHQQVLDALDRAFASRGGFFAEAADRVPTLVVTYEDAFANFVDHERGLSGTIAEVPAYTDSAWFRATLRDAFHLAHYVVRDHLTGHDSDEAFLLEPTLGFRNRLEPHLLRWLGDHPPPGSPWWRPGHVLEFGTDPGSGLRIDHDDDITTIFDTGRARNSGFRRRPSTARILAAHEELLNAAPVSGTTSAHAATYDVGAKHVLDLDAGRVRTYVSWREGFRRGETPEADAELLAVHMVEIANQLGYEDPEDAYEALKRMVCTYAPALPRARWALHTWLLEYTAAFPVSDTPDDASYYLHGLYTDQDHAPIARAPDASTITVWNRTREYEALDRNLLFAVTGYDMFGTKYGRETPDEERLLRVLRAAMRAAEGHFQDTYGKTIADQLLGAPSQHLGYRPLADVPTPRPLTAGRGRSVYGQHRLTNYGKLTSNVLKYAENLARKKDGVRGQRKVRPGRPFTVTLMDAIHDSIAPILDPPPEPIRVTIDHHHLHRLERASATLRQRLVHEADLHDAQDDTRPLDPVPSPPAAAVVAGAESRHTTVGIGDHDYVVLMEALSDTEREVVVRLAAGDTGTLDHLAKGAGLPTSLLIDAINEKALDSLGDTLIDTSGERLELFEEHADVLAPLAHSLENPA